MAYSVTNSTSAPPATRAASSTTGTTGTGSGSSAIGAAAGMGKDDFMQLLIAQLQNQDPMKPMDDKEFITQLAQFSSLEAMEKMTESMEELTGATMLVQAATMLGKQVTAKLPNGTTVTGTISQVRMLEGKPKLVVNNQEIDPSLVTSVEATTSAPSTGPAAGTATGSATGTTTPVTTQGAASSLPAGASTRINTNTSTIRSGS